METMSIEEEMERVVEISIEDLQSLPKVNGYLPPFYHDEWNANFVRFGYNIKD